ncbi:MAG: hypothetical protein VXX33_14695 [Pseudomonadota bacterium]|nr:hypothetical protein [Pseudomonadota bacterium]
MLWNEIVLNLHCDDTLLKAIFAKEFALKIEDILVTSDPLSLSEGNKLHIIREPVTGEFNTILRIYSKIEIKDDLEHLKAISKQLNTLILTDADPMNYYRVNVIEPNGYSHIESLDSEHFDLNEYVISKYNS